MKLSILIVAYNCSLESSATLNSILTSKLRFDEVQLCFWNNGPQDITPLSSTLAALEEQSLELTMKQTRQNAPLSWIYNHFIKSFPGDQYVILDHDSTLSREYLQHILARKKTFLGMPTILAKGAPQYPRSNRRFSLGPYTNRDEVFSIGSGLLLSHEATECIKHAYGNIFDENFALYGVDISLFKRIQKLGLTEKLESIPGFEHSLSKLESETKEVKHFRKVEASYDFGLMLRHYPSTRQLRILLKQILRSPFGKSRLFLTKVLKAFIEGRHERCRLPALENMIS